MTPSDAPADRPLSPRRFWLLVGGAAAAIMLGCWLSSGTMAPYGTYDPKHCGYRVNGDHVQFTAVYVMIAGHPAPEWGYSVVLRRILHPLLAFPLMRAFGFHLGGLLFNMLSHGIAMIALALALRRYFDQRAAVLACWLFATYPGYAYWAGLPYSYAFIVPGSIACTIALLWWRDQPSPRRAAIAACIIGVVATGYDLMPCFGSALLLSTLMRRRWRDFGAALVVLVLWALFVARGLPAIFGFSASNDNTRTYAHIIYAWLHFWRHWGAWGTLLLDVPRVFVSNFFDSNMLFLPLLLCWLVVLRLRGKIAPVFDRVALSILLSTLALFLFLNLAPPYDSWQMRGTWIARLYQPWFAGILIMVAATSVALRNTRRYKLFFWSCVVIAVLDAVTIAGPYVGIDKLYATLNDRFYVDTRPVHNQEWIDEYGVRPFGICR